MVTPATPDEWQKMYDVARDKRNKLRNRLMLCLMYCSLRVSDMLRIRIENIQWNRNIIIVAVKTTRRRKEKKVKGDKRKLKPLERRNINMVIDNHTKELLADYIKEKQLGTVGPLFSITRQRVWQIIKELAEKAGLDRMDFLSPHKLRHGFGTDITRDKHKLFKGTENLVHVQDQMGHADIRYTRIYLHYTPEDRKEAFGVK